MSYAGLTYANGVLITDKLAAARLAALGTSTNGVGAVGGTVGAQGKITNGGSCYHAIINALNDAQQLSILTKSAVDLAANMDVDRLVSPAFAACLSDLDRACAAAGTILAVAAVVDLDSYCTYYNTGAGGPWNMLLCPDFYTMFNAAQKAKTLSAQNVYFELLQGATVGGVTFTNALRKLVIGTGQTAGTAIDSTKYAGGFGQVKASNVTGSDTVTVTGTWRSSAGVLATGNGTATVSGNGTVVLTPPTSNALLVSVSAIVAGASLTAATIYAEALRPSSGSRTNPPT